MNRRLLLGVAAAVFCLGMAGGTRADLLVFHDQDLFLGSTGAMESATSLLDYSTGYVGTHVNLGDVHIYNSHGMYVGPSWTTRLAGNDLAVNGYENLDITIDDPVYSFGFQFVEPEHDPNVNAIFVDSTFRVTVLDGTNTLESFTYNAPNDQAWFVGLWSDTAFDTVQIREITGGNENEFFGRFYTGTVPVPEPSALLLIGVGLTGLFAYNRASRHSA